MSNSFMEASRLKLRFTTVSGIASTEDLWKLPYNTLATMEDELKDLVEKSTTKGSRRTSAVKSAEDKKNELRLEIVKEVLNELDKENDAAKVRLATKEKLQKLLELRVAKENEALGSLSLAEIDAQIAELNK
jgi:hypothetical protein